jgi:NAD-dependent deacetylase
MVELMPVAEEWGQRAHVLVVVGTSLQVYPAAGLASIAPSHATRFLVDPNPPPVSGFSIIRAGASAGLREVDTLLMRQ